jgi:hypothetical protein
MAGLIASSAQAAPLNITLDDFPDILSSFLTASYDATLNILTVSGTAMALDDDGSIPAQDITDGTFGLSATIDETGALSAGTLTIGGTVGAPLNFNSGTILTGDLTDFGFSLSASGNPFEFLFNVTGGDAANLFGGTGAQGGIILTLGSGVSEFSGSFESNFSNPNSAADTASLTAPVPEPTTWLLFLSGFGLIVGHVALRKYARQS